MNGKKARALRRKAAADNPQENRMVKSQKEKALDRFRKSGLFWMDIEVWDQYFDENPEQITTGFISFVINRRRAELARWATYL